MTVFLESNNIIRTISFNVVMILSLPIENILLYPNANINFMLLMKRWNYYSFNFIKFLRVVISETSAVKHSDIKRIAAAPESTS